MTIPSTHPATFRKDHVTWSGELRDHREYGVEDWARAWLDSLADRKDGARA